MNLHGVPRMEFRLKAELHARNSCAELQANSMQKRRGADERKGGEPFVAHAPFVKNSRNPDELPANRDLENLSGSKPGCRTQPVECGYVANRRIVSACDTPEIITTFDLVRDYPGHATRNNRRR